MSQENAGPSGRKHSRDSILKKQFVEDEEIITRTHRRVSFRNLKEIQYFNTENKNSPGYLHDGSPVKEKINDTLGSDGVFTPGRTTVSDNSNHSSKNNTIDMFGEAARKPIPIVPSGELAKFVVKETPPNTLDVTNFNTIDMSVTSVHNDSTLMTTKNNTIMRSPPSLEATNYDTMDMSVSNESTKMDDTLQIFSKSAVQGGDNISINDTIQMFSDQTVVNTSNRSIHNLTGGMDNTADMFANVDTVRPDTSLNSDETMDMFHVNQTLHAASNPDETMEMFKSPLATPIQKRVSMSTTMAMFQSPAEVQENESVINTDETILLFEDPNRLSTLHEAETGEIEVTNYTVSMLIDRTQRLDSSVIPTTKSSSTIVISSDVAVSNNIAGDCSMEENMNRTTMPRTSLLEVNRAMCMPMNFSMERFEPLEKSILLEKDLVSTSASIDMSHTAVSNDLNSSKLNSSTYLNFSSRSRRRSSMSNTIRDLIQHSPVPSVDANKSLDLSFSSQSSLFDDTCTNMCYLENGMKCSTDLHIKAHDQFLSDCKILQERDKHQLDTIFTDLEKRDPKKADALKNINSRKLGAIDRDLMLAARITAEENLFTLRAEVAKKYIQQIKEMDLAIDSDIRRYEANGEECQCLDVLEDEVARLNNEWETLNNIDIDAMKAVVPHHNRLIQEYEMEKEENGKLQIEALLNEKSFVEQKLAEQKYFATLLEAAKKEKEQMKRLMLDKLRKQQSESPVEFTSSTIEDDSSTDTLMESDP